MGLPEGRSAESWIDFNLFGHQLVTHLNPNLGPEGRMPSHCNPVDKQAVPVPHFGVVLTIEDWEALAERTCSFVDRFIIEPTIRFKGEPGEQCTMFSKILPEMPWSSKPLPTSKGNFSRNSSQTPVSWAVVDLSRAEAQRRRGLFEFPFCSLRLSVSARDFRM